MSRYPSRDDAGCGGMSGHLTPENGTSEAMGEDDLSAIASLLEDEYARAILRHTSEQPRSANDLMDCCDASKATTYRRIDRLREHDLLESYQEYDPDGHHYKRYVATVDEVSVTFEDGAYEVAVTRSATNPADRFTDLFEGLS